MCVMSEEQVQMDMYSFWGWQRHENDVDRAPGCRLQLPILPRTRHSAEGLTGED